ncbi:MAG: MerR family transcriptional regulator, partial [Acidimicrobiales bacterium]
QPAHGSGSQRLYSFEDLVELKLIKKLLDAGVGLHRVREAIDYLRRRGEDLTGVTLVSNGRSIYACRSPDEVVDLLRRGQGVFGIAIDPVKDELAGSVSRLRRAEPRGEPASPAATRPAGPVSAERPAARPRSRRKAHGAHGAEWEG